MQLLDLYLLYIYLKDHTLPGHVGHLKLMVMFKHLHGVLYDKRYMCVTTTRGVASQKVMEGQAYPHETLKIIHDCKKG